VSQLDGSVEDAQVTCESVCQRGRQVVKGPEHEADFNAEQANQRETGAVGFSGRTWSPMSAVPAVASTVDGR
jgi:hypothetical protein